VQMVQHQAEGKGASAWVTRAGSISQPWRAP
jgi:hypothetical protein